MHIDKTIAIALAARRSGTRSHSPITRSRSQSITAADHTPITPPSAAVRRSQPRSHLPITPITRSGISRFFAVVYFASKILAITPITVTTILCFTVSPKTMIFKIL